MDVRKKKKMHIRPKARATRIKTWLLEGKKKEEYAEEVIQEMEDFRLGTVEEYWSKLKDTVLKAATAKCRRTTGKAKKDNETWWWCEETQKAIQKKNNAFKKWQEVKTEEAKERYKEAKKEARRAVAKAKSEATEEWYQALDTKEGEKTINKVARSRQRARQDVGDLMVIKDEEG